LFDYPWDGVIAAPDPRYAASDSTICRSPQITGVKVIFKAVQDGRPYPDHGFSTRDWASVAPRSVRLDQLVTTKRELALDKLLDEDSTFYGDLFPHAVQWHGDIYLEDGLHRALRAALQQRTTMHVRVLDLDELRPRAGAQPAATSVDEVSDDRVG
jgi:Arc/MetJ family transcription regulator